jgi:hypothetical protein
MRITRMLAASVVAAALVAPAAQAAPIDAYTPGVETQDLRGADARGTDPKPGHEWSGASAAESASVRPASQPSGTVTASDGGEGVDVLSLGLGAAGALLAASGLAVVNGRRRQRFGATA